MKTIHSLLIAAAALMLPSCVQWNIGECIRNSQEVHTGVYLHVPEAEQYRVYDVPSSKEHCRYALAPEVTFRIERPTIETGDFGKHPRVVEVQFTGQRRLVRVDESWEGREKRGWDAMGLPCYPATLIDKLPEGATRMKPQDTAYASFRSTKASWGRRLAAAPFDYLIDPALTLTSSLIGSVGMGLYCIPLLIYDPTQVIPCSG